ncbi:hypothetical protein NVP1029O_53 [Vibrio phage 1.029.O._10N.261.55.A7]|nr:hypothetical protein NVP1029O_53 [Vibrio phage 1.029.O._10N.261.55.A7]
MNLIELQNKIHQQNISKGWWDNPRSFSTFTNLGVSEISEAVEADRKGLMDDKLEHYKGVPVESADGGIRTMDVLSSLGNETFDPSQRVVDIINAKGKDLDFLMALSTWCMSKAWEEMELLGNKGVAMQHLRDALFVLFEIMYMFNHNPIDLMLEKHSFNAVRPDHKRENREKEGGKKY